MSYKTVVVCFLLLFIWFCGPTQGEVFPLQAKEAEITGGARPLQNPDRLGFPHIDSQAKWILSKIPPGIYDIDLTYSAGGAEKHKRLGVVYIMVGTKRYKAIVKATGSWGVPDILTIPRVRITESDKSINVGILKRAPSVHTVFDLWHIEIEEPNTEIKEAGKLIKKRTEHGTYVQYIPRSLKTPPKILVLIHGTTGRNEPALACAENFLKEFLSVSREKSVTLLAPAFDNKNFGGYAGPGGGYRGLFGREISADEFLNEILSQYKKQYPKWDGKICIYGHSAGGQFVSRYLVMQPDNVISAVISAAGTYAFPNPKVTWADGMARLQRLMRWSGDDQPQKVDVQPDPEGWMKAATIPTTVIVGELDDTRLPESHGQPGENMLQRADLWVNAMNEFAQARGREGTCHLVVVNGAAHFSAHLSPIGIKHLFHNEP